MDNKIKDTILKSGIPLEVSVVDKLSDHGFSDLGEITYKREDKTFSTDIRASKQFTNKSGIVGECNLAMECKFRTPNHDWFFMRFPKDREISSRHDTGLITFTDYGRRLRDNAIEEENVRSINFGRLNSLFNADPVNKGVEIINQKKFDHSTVRKSMSQAIYGAIQAQKSALHYYTDNMGEALAEQEWQDEIDPKYIVGAISGITLPVVVTTAEIYQMKEGILLEDVKEADEPENLFRKVKAVKFLKNEDNAREFARKKFERNNIHFIDQMDKIARSYSLDLPVTNRYPPNISGSSPIYVVKYEYLDDFLENLENVLNNEI